MANLEPFDEQFIPAIASQMNLGETVCLKIARGLLPWVGGALEGLRYPDAWQGTPQDVSYATAMIDDLCARIAAVETCEATGTMVKAWQYYRIEQRVAIPYPTPDEWVTRTFDYAELPDDNVFLTLGSGGINLRPGTYVVKFTAGHYRMENGITRALFPFHDENSFDGTQCTSIADATGNALSIGVGGITHEGAPGTATLLMLQSIGSASGTGATLGRNNGKQAYSNPRCLVEIWRMEEVEVVGQNGADGPPGPTGQTGQQGEPGNDGLGVLMRATGSLIQWAQDAPIPDWQNLLDICEIECDTPPTPPDPPIPTVDYCEYAIRLEMAFKELLDYLKKAKEENDTWVELLNAIYSIYFLATGVELGGMAIDLMQEAYDLLRSDLPEWYPSVTPDVWLRVRCLTLEALVSWDGWDDHTAVLLRDWCEGERDLYEEGTDLYKFWEWLRGKLDRLRSHQFGWMANTYDLTPPFDCSDCEEPVIPQWGAEWDFTAQMGMGGWTIQQQKGEYVHGIGFIAQQLGAPYWIANMYANWAMIPTPSGVEDLTIDGIQMEWVTDEGTVFAEIYGYDKALYLSVEGLPVVITWQKVIDSGPLPPFGYYQVGWNYTGEPGHPGGFPTQTSETQSVNLMVIQLVDGDYTPYTNVILRRITVHGTGYNPFSGAGWTDVPYGPFG